MSSKDVFLAPDYPEMEKIKAGLKLIALTPMDRDVVPRDAGVSVCLLLVLSYYNVRLTVLS